MLCTRTVLVSKVELFDEHFVTSLVVQEGGCTGCISLAMKEGTVHGFRAGAVVVATGGYGRLYSRTTNSFTSTGDGVAIALAAGAWLKDMEFVQFHPTTLTGSNILISEAARGEGGILLNAKGERFMSRTAPRSMELAPRDIVARAIQREIEAGNGTDDGSVLLDLRGIGRDRINERLPGIRDIGIDFVGTDIIDSPIKVQPGQHYSMGGISTDITTATSIPGLYAAGECACVSVHGANRLGGNSLLETIVFGKIAGRKAVERSRTSLSGSNSIIKERVAEEEIRIEEMTRQKGTERTVDLRKELQRLMMEDLGIFRDGQIMSVALAKIEILRSRSKDLEVMDRNKVFNQSLIAAYECRSMLDIAEVVGIAALAREESRGSHARTDFPKRDDERFLKHSMVRRTGNGLELSWAPVTLGTFDVKERVY